MAFASTAGVNLLEKVLEPIRRRRGALLLVTTAFGSTSSAALRRARGLGVEVKVMNPGGGTFHPKVYIAQHGSRISLVVGSANLTGGIVNNVEMATHFGGDMGEEHLATMLSWSRDLWDSSAAVPWLDDAGVDDEVLSPQLFALITAAVTEQPVFHTVATGAPNTIVDVVPQGVYVETEVSRAKGAAAFVPAWMIQFAWEFLLRHGALTNKHLLASDGLNVKRSSFVLALLARLPGVEPINNPAGVRLQTVA